MIAKNKDSKDGNNKTTTLEKAIARLRAQDGIVIKEKNGKNIALYPSEFLNAAQQKKYKITNSPTLIDLAKRAGLLPSLAIIPEGVATKDWPIFLEKKLESDLDKAGGKIFETARAQLPLEDAEDSIIIGFRVQGGEETHLALIVGKPKKDQVALVRVHSSCVTGDLLGSLRCDCGSQLKLALDAIKKSGYGVLLYMNQEGRGIGINNKLRAYKLQEQGIDTFAANHALGFLDDERDFTAASSILKYLGLKKINLLSNNPRKVSELKKHGITIVKRLPLVAKTGKHNRAYIEAKIKKAGHIMKKNKAS